MRLIPNWQEILLDAASMRAAFGVLWILAFPEIAYAFLGFDIVSPYVKWWAALIFVAVTLIGRIIDQGISDGTRAAPSTVLARIRAGVLWLGLITVVMVGLSVGGWGLALVSPAEAMSVPPEQKVEAIAPVEAPPTPAMEKRGTVSAEEFAAVAVPFVGKWEGLRLKAYQDIVGVWTICYGHTRTAAPGQVKTKAKCDELLRQELLEYRDELHRYFTGETLVARLTPARDTAFTSLAFNVGWAGAGKSTAVRRLNDGDIRGSCIALTWWNKAGGRVVQGLVNRRTEEHALCTLGL
ncbi:MAG: lysozyme [Rhodobacter sp.]|nr:lysozyme [Rhodobacter sp.]